MARRTPMPQPTPPLRQRRHTLAALLMLGLGAAAPIIASPIGRSAGATGDRCAVPAELAPSGGALPHAAARLASGEMLTIVALGSSSTEGVGASRPELTYPRRLAAILQEYLPRTPIRVVNRGVSGETAEQMATRIDRDVVTEKPDLVIWQLGSNTVLRDGDVAAEIESLRRGIARLKAAGADVMLMDLQYAPAMLAHPGYREMLYALAAVARSEDTAIIHRFAMMRHWAEDGQMSLAAMLTADRLHMSDASYDCLARQVARGIIGTTSKPRYAMADERR
jgi:acyl-CoA thioesterase I